MSEPLVSVIIPTYNYAHLLRATLQSVLEQTYTRWECLIVDDGSTDDTGSIVHEFLSQHDKLPIEYIRTVNAGTSAAKNIGIERAKGEYIQFLDADDLLSADKLKTQVNVNVGIDAALVFSASRFFAEADGIKTEQSRFPEGFLSLESLRGYQLIRRLITNNMMTISSPLVKTSLVRAAGGFDITLRNNEDWMLWFRIALLQPHFEYDQNKASFVHIRIHGRSAMNQHMQMFLGEVRVREEIDKLLSQRPHTAENKQLRKLNQDLLALHRVRSLKISQGLSYIMSNFIAQPIANFSLLRKGYLKLMVRIYKTVIKNEH